LQEASQDFDCALISELCNRELELLPMLRRWTRHHRGDTRLHGGLADLPDGAACDATHRMLLTILNNPVVFHCLEQERDGGSRTFAHFAKPLRCIRTIRCVRTESPFYQHLDLVG
jgi:hypothetical protein